jgi:RNA polymerase sigma factor (sigma-70 family)
MKTYLFSIARNLALKQYRDHRAEEPLECMEGGFAAGFEAGFEAPGRADPLAALETSAAVAEAVALLPQLQQEALVLFEYERFTLEEIAQIVGADTGTVKSRLHRARERLRRVLAPYRKVGNAHGTV